MIKRIRFFKNTDILITVLLVIVAAAGLFYVWKDIGSTKGMKVQTTSMVLLVLVTIFYAFQTRYLVNWQKKEKQIDFIYSRVKDFLYPLLWTLSEIEVSLKELNENEINNIDNNVQAVLKEVRGFGFLVEEGIFDHIQEWHDRIFECTTDLSNKLKKDKAIKINNRLSSTVKEKYRIYQNILKNFYKIPVA